MKSFGGALTVLSDGAPRWLSGLLIKFEVIDR